MARRIQPEEAVEIGLRLRHAREAFGWTLKQVASACGGDHTRVSKVERGKFASLNPYVQKLCKYLHIDLDAPDDASPQALHARLDRLIRERPGAAAALRAVFDAFELMAS
jgi:transcriptional regulator with XRE-family HTH domain